MVKTGAHDPTPLSPPHVVAERRYANVNVSDGGNGPRAQAAVQAGLAHAVDWATSIRWIGAPRHMHPGAFTGCLGPPPVAVTMRREGFDGAIYLDTGIGRYSVNGPLAERREDRFEMREWTGRAAADANVVGDGAAPLEARG